MWYGCDIMHDESLLLRAAIGGKRLAGNDLRES
jgi:hypothetical protein